MAQVVSEDFTVAREGLTLQGHVEYPQGSTHDREVICMHGFLRDMGVKPGELYQDISDALPAHGLTCERFDFNGRGRSEGAFEDSDVFNQIEDAIAVLDISDALPAHGLTCERFDFNGRGRSEGAFEDSDVFNQIEDAIAVLNHGCDAYVPLEISLLVHSQGGVVAGMTAGMFADVIHTLVMLAPAASLKAAAAKARSRTPTYSTRSKTPSRS